jgi:molybdate transport system permease protein
MIDPASAVRLSLVVALASTLVGLAPAVGAGWLLARGRFRGKSLLTAIIMAPLVLPPVVTGLLLLRAFGRSTPLGGLLEAAGLPISFSLFGAGVAALVVGFPLYVLSIRGAFEAVDPRYAELSLTLGVPPRATWRRITLPLALPGVAAGAVLAFARALGEFGATAIIAGNIEGRTRTIALAVYALLDSPDGEAETTTLLLASVSLSAAALLGYELLNRWQRRRLDLDVD